MKSIANIIDTAVGAGSFKTLVTALEAAALVDTLKGMGPFTVFAPNDDAFAKLPAGTVEALLKDIPRLKGILMYHVVSGKVMSLEVAHMKTAKTLQGQEIRIDASMWHLHRNTKINNAEIIKADITADNGVIHAINEVLMPNPELTCPEDGMGFANKEEMMAHTKTAHPMPVNAPM